MQANTDNTKLPTFCIDIIISKNPQTKFWKIEDLCSLVFC